jgi:anti-anti-sigma regulatory factor
MDVRIEKKSDGEGTVIQVAGELRGQGVAELERLCRESTGHLSLDLSNLRAVEAKGVQLIRELSAKGVKLLGVTPYVDLLLKDKRS